MTINIDNQNDEAKRDKSIAVLQSFFELMHKKDIEAWGRLWNENAVILVPYPPKGFPTEIKGLSNQILPGFRQLFAKFETYDYAIKEVYRTTNPEVIIVEWDVTATIKDKELTYNGQNITVFKFANDKISEYHDYFNPIQFQAVVDSL